MREKAPSRTALRVALRRVAHQILDKPKVLDAPLAVPIVGEAAREIRMGIARHQSRAGRHFRAFMVVSRYAEDQLKASVARGVEQYVVLGAGLDTSVYRGAPPDELHWFLKGLGYGRVEQLGSKEIHEKYFAGRADGLQVAGAAGRIVGAWV